MVAKLSQRICEVSGWGRPEMAPPLTGQALSRARSVVSAMCALTLVNPHEARWEGAIISPFPK